LAQLLGEANRLHTSRNSLRLSIGCHLIPQPVASLTSQSNKPDNNYLQPIALLAGPILPFSLQYLNQTALNYGKGYGVTYSTKVADDIAYGDVRVFFYSTWLLLHQPTIRFRPLSVSALNRWIRYCAALYSTVQSRHRVAYSRAHLQPPPGPQLQQQLARCWSQSSSGVAMVGWWREPQPTTATSPSAWPHMPESGEPRAA
jgi:hypothetical protein